MTEGGRTVLLLFVTAAAASDLKWGRICNFLTLTSLAGGIWLLALHAPQEIPGVLGAMVLLACFLFPFWKSGGLGAGDIKMLMALVLFFNNSFVSDRGGDLRVLTDQISGFIPNRSFCCTDRYQRRALSASRAIICTEPFPFLT